MYEWYTGHGIGREGLPLYLEAVAGRSKRGEREETPILSLAIG